MICRLDGGTKKEHKENTREQEAQMADFMRDLAAFTSMIMFVTTVSAIMISF
jgi:hypothetical protein